MEAGFCTQLKHDRYSDILYNLRVKFSTESTEHIKNDKPRSASIHFSNIGPTETKIYCKTQRWVELPKI